MKRNQDVMNLTFFSSLKQFQNRYFKLRKKSCSVIGCQKSNANRQGNLNQNFNIIRDFKASYKHNKTFSFFPPGGSVVQPTCIGLHARFIIAKKRRKRRSGKGYDGPRSELYSNSSRKMQAAALAGSFTIVCRAAAVGRWLSVRLSVPRSCCRSSQLPGGETTKAKI